MITNIDQLSPEMREAATPVAPVTPAGVPTDGGPMPTPNAPVSGVPGPVGTLPAGMNPPEVTAPAPVPFSQALQGNTNAASAATPPAAANVPGHWARTLIAGALKSLPSAINNVETSLGDMSAANEEIQRSHPAGGAGILDYIGAQQNAKNNRLQQQQQAQTKEDVERGKIAYTNTQNLIAEQTLHALKGKVSDQINDEAIQHGLASYNLAVIEPALYGLEPGKIVKGGGGTSADISQDELNKALNDKSWDPTKDQYDATSKIPSMDGGKPRLDSEGNQMWEKRFTIYTTPPKGQLSKENADFINANIPGSKWEEGQPMSGADALMLMQQARTAHIQKAVRASEMEEADIKLSSLEHTKQQLDANKVLDADADYQKARAHISGLENLSLYVTGQAPTGRQVPEVGPDGKPTGRTVPEIDKQSSDYAKAHPNALVQIRNSYGFDKKTGESIFDKILADQQEKEALAKDKALEKATAKDPLLKLETDPAEMTGDKSAAAQALLQNMLNNPDTPVESIPRIQRLIKQADVAANNYQAFKQTEEETKERIADGSPEDAAQLLVSGLVSPQQLISSRKPAFATKAFTSAQVLQPGWSASKSDADYNYARNPTVQSTLNMITSMTSPGGSIDIVKSTIDKFPKVPVQVANQVFNPLATQFGSQDVTDFHVAMLGLADEFSKIMGAQAGGSDTARQQALDILKDSYSKGQLNSGVDILRRLVQARGKYAVGNNPTLQRMYPDIAQFQLTAQAGAPQATDNIPKNTVHVQIPGQPAGYIPAAKLADFQKKHPNAQVIQ